MCSGNITGDGWMKRSMLWNILALQNPDGSWNVSDSLAAALRAAGEPRAGGAHPQALAAAHRQVLLRRRGARAPLPARAARVRDAPGTAWWTRYGSRCWPWRGARRRGSSGCSTPGTTSSPSSISCSAAGPTSSSASRATRKSRRRCSRRERAAKTCITEWREGFVAAATALRAARAAEEARAKKLAQAKEKGFIAKACLALWWALTSPVGFVTFWVKYLIGFVKWGLRLYFAAHIFLRAFLANPTDAFSGAERVVMQTTCYLAALIITVWFYYNKATQCCVMLREDIGCSSDVLEACDVVPAGAGCAAFMAQKQLKPAGWSCGAFPDKKNGWHFLTVIAIQIAIMFPVKFTLTRMFTAGGGGVLEPHWRQAVVAAGMNMMEVRGVPGVPVSSLRGPRRRVPETRDRQDHRPVLRRVQEAAHGDAHDLLHVLRGGDLLAPGQTRHLAQKAEERGALRGRCRDPRGASARSPGRAPTRRTSSCASKTTTRPRAPRAPPSPAASPWRRAACSPKARRAARRRAASDGAADAAAGLAAAGDVAAGPASTVFGSPAAPKRELPHMRALCGEGGHRRARRQR